MQLLLFFSPSHVELHWLMLRGSVQEVSEAGLRSWEGVSEGYQVQRLRSYWAGRGYTLSDGSELSPLTLLPYKSLKELFSREWLMIRGEVMYVREALIAGRRRAELQVHLSGGYSRR